VPEQAPWLKPFQVMLSDSSLSLGEPRGWWRAFMPVPLFGHLHTSLKNLFPDDYGAPLNILMLGESDLLFIQRHGIEGYFRFLSDHQIAWHTSLYRPVIGMQLP
ncbi:MAG: hypothetical protein KDK39_12930, partial [Leptospiraceae bacterium]|nr:hypothetical protein [Leptospiraceae bacterium]